MLTLCFVTLKQSRKLHADISPVHRASEKRYNVYPVAFYDGRVPAFSDFSGKEGAEKAVVCCHPHRQHHPEQVSHEALSSCFRVLLGSVMSS